MWLMIKIWRGGQKRDVSGDGGGRGGMKRGLEKNELVILKLSLTVTRQNTNAVYWAQGQ